MFSSSAITKLHAAIALVVVIVASAGVGALYLQRAPEVKTSNVVTELKTPDAVTLHLDWVAQGRFVAFDLAVEKGYYKRQNLEVTIYPGQGGVQTVTNVAAGKYDFGYADAVPLILARNKGSPVKAAAVLATDTPQGFAFLLKSGIKTPKDFEGKRIITTQSGVIYESMPLFCKVTKIDCARLSYVFVAPGLYTQTLLGGQGDVLGVFKGSSYETAVIEAAKIGEKVGFIGFPESGLDIYGTLLFTTEKTMKEKPDLVRRFVAATMEGFRYSINNPDEAVSTYLKLHPELNKAILELQWKDVMGESMIKPTWNGAVESDKMVRTINAVQSVYNMTSIDPQSVYTNQFIPTTQSQSLMPLFAITITSESKERLQYLLEL